MNHIFIEFPFSISSWNLILGLLKCPPILGPSLYYWNLKACLAFKGKSTIEKLGKLCFNQTIYHLWKERNSRTYSKSYKTPQDIATTICEQVLSKVHIPNPNPISNVC